jgi:trehalose 6-phosphate phosphatase
VVAVISGRPNETLRRLLPVDGVVLVGLYGVIEDQALRGKILAVRGSVEAAIANVNGAWIEDKGVSLSVHYRAASDPATAEALLVPGLERLADQFELSVVRGKMVIEVAAGAMPGKGAVVERLVTDHALAGCLYAGDDQPDLDAFSALDRLTTAGKATVKVAVRTEETPEELLDRADLVVDRPAGLVALLSRI